MPADPLLARARGGRVLHWWEFRRGDPWGEPRRDSFGPMCPGGPQRHFRRDLDPAPDCALAGVLREWSELGGDPQESLADVQRAANQEDVPA